ncbi:MAG: SBBP repeat-containing protein [Pyrinomonadaceae bacterium]
MKTAYRFPSIAGILALALIFNTLVPGMTRKVAAATSTPKANAVAPVAPESARNADLGKLPLIFEENRGQTAPEAKFISRGKGYTLYLTETEAIFQLRQAGENTGSQKAPTRSDNLRMRLVGANPNPVIVGADEITTKTNYYTGKNRIENVANYGKVDYHEIYDGVDAVFYGNRTGQLEYDLLVAPNADTNQIKFNFEGAMQVSVNDQGELVVGTAHAELVQAKPFAYQETDGVKHEIASHYLVSGNTVSFAVGDYDRSRSLVIDPTLGYLTYLGGNLADQPHSIRVDASGNAFVSGTTASLNFPTANSRSSSDDFGVFVSKISANGQSLLYNTFLEGGEDDGITDFDIGAKGTDIAIDAAGNAYITGVTESSDFPISDNAYQRIRLCSRSFGVCIFPEEAFVTKLNPVGSIVYSTFLGGRHADFANGITVDSAGRAYVTGATDSGLTFPTKNQYQGTGLFSSDNDAFITVFNADGSDILYSSGLGGNDVDQGNGIALDSSNNVYIVGTTFSTGSFPTKNPFQAANGGGRDAFVAKFNTSASGDDSLLYSTFLGGSGGEEGNGIAVDSNGQAHVTGLTGSFNYPLKNPIRATNQINEAFVTVLNQAGTALVNSTFLGGSDQEEGRSIVVGSDGLIYVTGDTLSTNFPTALPFQSAKQSGRDAFVTKLKFGSGILSSSYLGGNGNDSGTGIAIRGNQVFVCGATGSTNLATTSGVLQPNPGAASNNSDGFVAKVLDSHIDSVGVFRPASTFLLTQSTSNVVSVAATITSQLAGQKGVSGDFDGDGITTIGSFTNGVWKVRNSNFPVIVAPAPFGATTLNFGTTGDLPVVGDWNGDGIDTIGVFRPGTGQFLLSNDVSNPNVDLTITFGSNGDLPVAGDWDGDGVDSVGVFRPSAVTFFLTNQNVPNPGVDITTFFGISDDLPVTGDWNGDGRDTIGVWRPSAATFFLSNNNAAVDITAFFGQNGDQPIAGDWDGKP